MVVGRTVTIIAFDGKATTIRKVFSRETAVGIEIYAGTGVIWKLLTDGTGYPKWNSTVISIAGSIASNGRIKLQSVLDPNRTFRLSVKTFEPERQLVWGDAMGNRVFNLAAVVDNHTMFTMTEKIGGPLFPLFARMIPSFDESFEIFAADLKTAAEQAEADKNS
jgi:hypothetical protein